jgi:hydroxyacylglutathione hydrolase
MQVSKHIHALKIPFDITDSSGQKIPRFVYVYLIYGEKICLIDSGIVSSEKIIFDYLKKTGRTPEDISLLVLTHSHPDHIGSAKIVKMTSECIVAAHRAEVSWIQDVDLQFRERPVPGFYSLVGGSVKIDRILDEGDVLVLEDGLSLKVLHTPGHSRGSISLWFSQEGALFSGDAIPLAGDMPIYDDALESARSIMKLKSIEGIKVLLAAWDDPRSGNQPYEIIDKGLHYIQRIHDAVIKAVEGQPTIDSIEHCKPVLKELGLPETMANPLIVRSFQSNSRLRERQDILQR